MKTIHEQAKRAARFVTRGGLLIVAGMSLNPETAQAQACDSCVGAGLARNIISANGAGANNNAGVSLRSNGAAQWDLAMVGAPGASYFTIFNSQIFTDALRIQTNFAGGFPPNTVTFYGDLKPNVHITRNVGSSSASFNAMYAQSYFGASDRRLKTDIKPLGSALDTVLKLRPVSFKWTKEPTGKEHLGLIAQEVREILPQIVESSDEPGASMMVAYAELTPVLIRAMQEQQAVIKRQSERLAALEAARQPLSTLGGVGGGALFALPFALGMLWQARRRRATGTES